MALFKFGKKNTNKILNTKTNSVGEPLDKLTKEGELPWGWVSYNKSFVEQIQKEFLYFLNNCKDSDGKHPKEIYSAKKSLVLYLEDVKKLCDQKGECFTYWFDNILVSKDYLEKNKKELKSIEDNFDVLCSEYERKKFEEEYKKHRIGEIQEDVVQLLKENDGILQSEFWKLFDSKDKEAVADIVFSLVKSGKLEKVKSGRSFTLHLK